MFYLLLVYLKQPSLPNTLQRRTIPKLKRTKENKRKDVALAEIAEAFRQFPRLRNLKAINFQKLNINAKHTIVIRCAKLKYHIDVPE